MQYIANIMKADIDVAAFARELEGAGWDGIAVADHTVNGDRLWPHVFVAAAAACVGSDQLIVTTAFANNLFRSRTWCGVGRARTPQHGHRVSFSG